MREKKRIMVATFMLIFSAMFSAICCNKDSVLYDISITAFGSVLLGFVLSSVEYITERQKTMELFLEASKKCLSELRQYRYISLDMPIDLLHKLFGCWSPRTIDTSPSTAEDGEPIISFSNSVDSFCCSSKEREDAIINEYIFWYRNNFPESDITHEEIKADLPVTLESHERRYISFINSCIAVSKIDVSFLEKTIAKMDFVFCNKSLKARAYKILTMICKYRDLPKECWPGIGSYSGFYVFLPIAEKAHEIHQQIFENRITRENKITYVEVFQAPLDQIDDEIERFWEKIYGSSIFSQKKHCPVATEVC